VRDGCFSRTCGVVAALSSARVRIAARGVDHCCTTALGPVLELEAVIWPRTWAVETVGYRTRHTSRSIMIAYASPVSQGNETVRPQLSSTSRQKGLDFGEAERR
jgi:hypothetical protein